MRWASSSATSRSAFFSLAAVVLAVTGAEALYADMGHFGRPPITRAWLVLVFPACILSYLGQGALVLGEPGAGDQQPVLPAGAALGPGADGAARDRGDGDRLAGGHHRRVLARPPGRPARLPAAAADRPTSEERIGQIYVPWINWVLMVSVLTLVFAFRDSAALAFAFGMAVTGTITITTLLFFYIVRHQWRKPLWLVLAGRRRLPRRRPAVPRREPDQAHARGVAAAADRRRACSPCSRPGSAAARSSPSGASSDEGSLRAFVDELHATHAAAAAGARHRSVPEPRQARPRRWRCAPTSSTTTSCTSTS